MHRRGDHAFVVTEHRASACSTTAAVHYRSSGMHPHRRVLCLAKSRAAPAVMSCLLGACATLGASAPVAGASTSSVQRALARSLGAARDEGSVRITVDFYSGSTAGKVVQDSAFQSGEQTIAIGKERASVVLVGRMAYISGNGPGMTSYFGLPSSLVPTLTGRWISIRPSDSAFEAVAGNVTLASALANVTPAGNLHPGKRSRVNHQSVRSIAGTARDGGRLTLFVSAGGHPLPVEAVESSGTGSSAKGEIVRFTRWGEDLHVPKPSAAVPISTLQAAPPAGG